MNILHKPVEAGADPRQRFVLQGITWQGYEKLLDGFAGMRVRLNYDRGTLELMTVYPPHEMLRILIGLVMGVLTEELLIPIKAVGSPTLRRPDVERALEPDGAYYLASIPRVRSWREIDLAVDPPPDLCVEVEISRSVADRLGIYAALGVPELWRCDGETLQAWQLGADGKYQRCPQSPSLPFVPLDEVLSLIAPCLDQGYDGAWLRTVRAWVRERVLPLWEAAGRPGAAQQ